jgi:hypothetical protein
VQCLGPKGCNPGAVSRRRVVGLLAVLLVTVIPEAVAVSPARAAGDGCQSSGVSTQRLGRVPELAEASGLVASKRYPGVGWVIRDSGHTPSIYSFRMAGDRSVVREIKVLGADNRDWEDITYSVGPDGKGRLWIVESMQSSRDPYIYEVVEPNPHTATTVRLKSRRRFQYPGDRFQNTEASFWYDGHLVLATKSSPTRLYRFDSLAGEGILRPKLIGALEGAPRISVLRPSPDHSALVASSHQTVSVFTGKGKGSDLADFVGKKPASRDRSFPNDNVEAGDYFPAGSCRLLMLSEQKNLYRVGVG